MIAEAMVETFFSDAVEDTRQRLQPGEMAGWSDFVPFYDLVVEAAPPGSAIVEVGVFCGKSLIHLAKAAKAANKRLRIYGVDTFQGSPEFVGRVWFDDKPIHECHPATLVSECIANLTTHGVRNDVTLIVGDSAKSAELFADQGVFAVMIDAAHERPSTARASSSSWMVAPLSRASCMRAVTTLTSAKALTPSRPDSNSLRFILRRSLGMGGSLGQKAASASPGGGGSSGSLDSGAAPD